MMYASLEHEHQNNPVNHILVGFRKDTSEPDRFLIAMFWEDLWFYDDEMARRNHAEKVISRWTKVFGPAQ